MSQTKTMTEKSELPAYFYNVISGLFNRIPKLDSSKVKIEEFTDTSSLLVSIPKDSRSDRKFFVVIREIVRPSHIETLKSLVEKAPKPAVPIIAAPTISETVIDKCHKQGWGHLDASGNCFLSAYPIFIERAGRPIPPEFKSKKRLPQHDLSSERESKIVRAILRADRLEKHFTDRDVTNWCDNRPSLGYVYQFLRFLASEGYIEKQPSDSGFRLKSPASLLRDWASARTVVPDFSISSYRFAAGEPIAQINNLDSDLKRHIAFAAYSARPNFPAVTPESPMYLRVSKDALPQLEDALKLNPTQDPSQVNLLLMVSQSEVALSGKRKTKDGRQTTNPLQTYIDLLSVPGSHNAAEDFLNTSILPHFGKSDFKD